MHWLTFRSVEHGYFNFIFFRFWGGLLQKCKNGNIDLYITRGSTVLSAHTPSEASLSLSLSFSRFLLWSTLIVFFGSWNIDIQYIYIYLEGVLYCLRTHSLSRLKNPPIQYALVYISFCVARKHRRSAPVQNALVYISFSVARKKSDNRALGHDSVD